ncbi:phosphatidylethanolamine N-methyltransferase, partial [Aureobasidium melanogenum]
LAGSEDTSALKHVSRVRFSWSLVFQCLRTFLSHLLVRAQQKNRNRDAQNTVKSLNDNEADKDESRKRTYGRTPDGKVFVVPQTHDMVSQLLSPTQPKNVSDIVILAVLACHVALLYFLPDPIRIPILAIVFLFWRAAYNAGIGWLLNIQSNHKRLTSWARKYNLFADPKSGKNPRPWLYYQLKREMETKIARDYKFEEAPLEYNTWLVFRRVVDLILMSDFVAYCCFAIACGGRPDGENVAMTLARWLCGLALVAFNLWVKLDAHRVVKDYAWYWGDFFYLIDQELTFDGVFEMAPHPMYSVGYVGFYGISLMAASYKVLFISIIAHAAQFAFLTIVENPHIEKTYNPPTPKKRRESESDREPPKSATPESGHINGYPPIATTEKPSSVHNILGFHNMDLHRVTDVSVLLMQSYLFSVAFLTPSTPLWQTAFVVNAVAWRLWYSLGLGYILDRQSNKKKWARHFVKYGESTEEAWRQWKGLYHLSMSMCTASFLCAALKMYNLPPDWTYGLALLRHVLGMAMIALQIWTSFSIYESLGEFGWFFGDFFFDHASKLTYGGIYRFLNNPERVLGLAGLWGVALITWSKTIFFLALLSHLLTLVFIQFVERPHMEKLYGRSLRQDSGLSKSLKRSLPSPLKHWQGSVDRVLEDSMDFLEDFIDSARPKLASSMDTFVRDTRTLFKNYPARISITRLAPDLAGFDPKDYSLEIEGTPASGTSESERYSGREGEIGQVPQQRVDQYKTLTFEYGAPIKTTRHAMSPVSDLKTGILVSSHQVTKDGKQYAAGEVEFSGDKLWWTHGIFEFRYHHDGKHNVMATSRPFEVRIGKFDEDDVQFDNINLARSARLHRVPLTIYVSVSFGIEFAPEVVLADGSVQNLAWRICNAKKVLAPYSMTPSRGRSTPAEMKA